MQFLWNSNQCETNKLIRFTYYASFYMSIVLYYNSNKYK